MKVLVFVDSQTGITSHNIKTEHVPRIGEAIKIGDINGTIKHIHNFYHGSDRNYDFIKIYVLIYINKQ